MYLYYLAELPDWTIFTTWLYYQLTDWALYYLYYLYY